MAQKEGGAAVPAKGAVLHNWNEASSAPRCDGEPLEIKRLLIRVNGVAGDLGPPRTGVGPELTSRLGDELFRSAERWLDIVRSWVEVFSLQDLDHLHPRWSAHIEGAGVATFTPEGERLGLGGRVRLDTHWPEPVSRPQLERALSAAGNDEYPALAHLLLRDARAAWYRGQTRRSIIDSATATEVSLAELATRRGITISKPNPTLGTYMHELHAAGILGPHTFDGLKQYVLDHRNAAVHRGADPGGWDAAEGAKRAQSLVWNVFPL